MKTKIYHGRDLIGRFTCDGRVYTKLQLYWFLAKRMAKKCMIASLVIVIGGWLFTAGVIMARSTIQPERVWAKEVIEIPIRNKAPIMEQIKKCESGGKHFDPKTGQVYMIANTNKTVDVGSYMINTVWHKKAKELGFDITTEKGNEDMAYWIYENVGTSPWEYSSKCWR